jgi:hypothetical protein
VKLAANNSVDGVVCHPNQILILYRDTATSLEAAGFAVHAKGIAVICEQV